MNRFVLEASIVLTWCFPDEESQKALEVSERIVASERVVVPSFWRHEMLNALLVGARRKRLTPELTQAFLEDLDPLPVDVDVPAFPGARPSAAWNQLRSKAAKRGMRCTEPA